jgi:hypothetical protein
MPSNVYNRKGELPTAEEVRDWIFTFGCGQGYAGRYVVIHGTFESAREEMVRRHGQVWSMQYRTQEDAGVETYGLKELK